MKTLDRIERRHINAILTTFESQIEANKDGVAIDLLLRSYFKQHKSLGANERRNISENVFQLLRHKTYLDVISPKPLSWNVRLDTLHSRSFETQKDNTSLLKNVRCSCPKELWNVLVEAFGEGKAFEYCNNLNARAPLTVRVNTLKIQRDELLKRWQQVDKMACRVTQYSPYGIQFTNERNKNLFDLPEFKKGYFEIQDEASQLVGLRVEAKPGDKIIDYCAGSGGKTLTFAPLMKGVGAICLHDTRQSVEKNAKKRLSRAGVNNVFLAYGENKTVMKQFVKKCDWVVLDVPCSGTGTLRRNPDIKIKFTRDRLNFYVDLQRSIIDEAIKYAKPQGGKFVYTTCSILPQENIDQIAYACKKHNLEVVGGKHFECLPDKPDGMDSFFSATLQFKS